MDPAAKVKAKRRKARMSLPLARQDLDKVQVESNDNKTITKSPFCAYISNSNVAVSFVTEDVSEEEHSEDDEEVERENGNHIPAGEKEEKTVRRDFDCHVLPLRYTVMPVTLSCSARVAFRSRH